MPPVEKKPPLDKEQWKALCLEMWTAIQGVADATDTLLEDYNWAEEHPEKISIAKKSKGQGEEFATFRAKRRINFDDLAAVRKVAKKFKKIGILHNGIEDRRGGQE